MVKNREIPFLFITSLLMSGGRGRLKRKEMPHFYVYGECPDCDLFYYSFIDNTFLCSIRRKEANNLLVDLLTFVVVAKKCRCAVAEYFILGIPFRDPGLKCIS